MENYPLSIAHPSVLPDSDSVGDFSTVMHIKDNLYGSNRNSIEFSPYHGKDSFASNCSLILLS